MTFHTDDDPWVDEAPAHDPSADDPWSPGEGFGPDTIESPPTTPLTRWAPRCPRGNSQRPVSPAAYRDKGGGLLQLLVPLDTDEGPCSIIVQEGPEVVLVRVILCRHKHDHCELLGPYGRPIEVWLEEPLNHRGVIDIESGEDLMPHLPHWHFGWQ